LKLGFWPAIAFALFEFSQLRRVANNFLLAKTVGICLIPTVIVVIFYSYTTIIGESLLVVDILTFILAVIIGQAASYKLMMFKPLPSKLNVLSIVVLLLLGFAFLFFTFYPPALPLFQDPVTGGYGIINH
jgi:chromate transport protein ChrA